MKPNAYKILQRCIDDGIAYGMRRAFKHTESPTREEIGLHIERAITTEICEWFKFDEVKEDQP